MDLVRETMNIRNICEPDLSNVSRETIACKYPKYGKNLERGALTKKVRALAEQGYDPNWIYHMLDKERVFEFYASEKSARTAVHTIYKRWKAKQPREAAVA
jgi:predicted Zn-dependent protease